MSLMRSEALEAPEAVARFLSKNNSILNEIGQHLRRSPPPAILTSARGSSDHAAAYFQYLAGITTGTLCASIGASIVSVYQAKLHVAHCLAVTISQSGQSPDIIAVQEAARAAGALSVAIVNAPDAPVAQSADIYLPLYAGVEKSVAATKSFITSLVAGASIVAAWTGDRYLYEAILKLPHQLKIASEMTWPIFQDHLKDAGSLYVLGRGPGLAIAAETALKLKETCALHAEAYSVAEVMHGPLEIVAKNFPILVYAQQDAAYAGTVLAVEKLRKAGARVMVVGGRELPVAPVLHPLLEPIAMIQTAYLMIENLAQLRGRNPDQPRLLKKVTETI